MARVKRVFITKLIIAFCVVSQLFAALPHHHHDGEMPCYVLAHCHLDAELEHGCEGLDMGCCSHQDHEDGRKNAACQITHVDIIEPNRDLDKAGEQIVFNSLGFTLFGIYSPMETSRLDGSQRAIKIERSDGAEPLYTRYMVVAIPPRAPSFTV